MQTRKSFPTLQFLVYNAEIFFVNSCNPWAWVVKRTKLNSKKSVKMGHPTVYVETWTTLAQDSLAAPMLAQESSILWPQRNRWSGAKKSGLGVQRNPLSSHGTAHRLCRVRRPWQIGAGEKIKNIKEIPSAPFPPPFCAHSRREDACSATLALASISIPERVASSPAGELISRQNQTPTALVPGVELHKHGLWIQSSTNKASNLSPASTFYVGHTL